MGPWLTPVFPVACGSLGELIPRSENRTMAALGLTRSMPYGTEVT